MTEEHATPSLQRSRRIWPVLAVLTAATFWTVTLEMLPSGLLPSMSRDLRVSESAIGVLVSAWAVTIVVASILLVRLTLKVPRTVLLTISLAATAPANLLTALAPDYTFALIGRVLAATAHGLFWAVVVSYVATIVDPARVGRALSIVLAGPALAGLAGLPTAAFIAEHSGWRGVFSGLSVFLALTACALWFILPRHTQTPGAQETTGVWDRSARGVVLVAFAGGLVLMGHFAAFTYITTLITGLGGLGSSAIPAVLLVLGATGGLGVAVSGVASDQYPRAAVIAAAAMIATGLILLRLGDGYPVLFVTGTIVWGFAIGAFPPILQARVLRLSSPSFRPLAGSIVVSVLNLGIASGATLGGIILELGQATLVLTALISTAIGTLGLALKPPTHPADAGT
ncbi:MFS transporter [Nesterenkonia ebinurensis]|uniref:MFS transporter n=1 Tax=Nesterenkonia ebinurensis TaxID=2608252 RepID=UPI00123DDF96|nr:MFS transporter [Nesterenkonia ebinurensis]